MGVHLHPVTHVPLKSSMLGSYINHCMHVWFKLVIFLSDTKGKRKQIDKTFVIKESLQVQECFCFEITDKIPPQEYSIDSLIIFNMCQFKSLWQN